MARLRGSTTPKGKSKHPMMLLMLAEARQGHANTAYPPPPPNSPPPLKFVTFLNDTLVAWLAFRHLSLSSIYLRCLLHKEHQTIH